MFFKNGILYLYYIYFDIFLTVLSIVVHFIIKLLCNCNMFGDLDTSLTPYITRYLIYSIVTFNLENIFLSYQSIFLFFVKE